VGQRGDPFESAGHESVIVADHHHPAVAAHMRQGEFPVVGHAEPLAGPDVSDARIAYGMDYVSGLVAAAVVAHEDFERIIILRRDGLQRRAEDIAALPRWDDHSESGDIRTPRHERLSR